MKDTSNSKGQGFGIASLVLGIVGAVSTISLLAINVLNLNYTIAWD